ncbi:MAG: exosortase/archaeosortase family protein [Candidatus Bathyarchaeia archaeon]|nr:archaeosortase/exosortase family protein [Candidatus Bathyarchaeota archaeon]
MKRLFRKLKSYLQIILQVQNLARSLFALSSTISVMMLYFLYPESYNITWKGRAYYIFFLWLALLENALNWGKINVKIDALKSKRFLASAIVAFLPITYILIVDFFEVDKIIIDSFPKRYGMSIWAESMPLTIEYIILAALFSLTVILAYGKRGLRYLALPISLSWAIGTIFLIDNLYPFGEFTPFQMIVPATSMLASSILSLIGYNTELRGQIYGATTLRVWSNKGEATFGIAWPCSGVEGLILYSVVTALFLRDSKFSQRQKILCFLVGAAITYFINALRIAMIFIIAIEYGVASPEVQRFHGYYGPLFSVMWILAYQLIIAAQSLWNERRTKGAT